MSGHNEAPSTFEKVLPEIVRGVLADIASYGAREGRRAGGPAGGGDGAAGVRRAELAFASTMQGVYAYIERELERLERPLAEMSEAELATLAERLAGSLKGG